MKKLENTIENIRIDTAITELSPEYDLNFTRSKIQKMIENGKIKVNSKTVKSSYKLKAGDIIEIDEKEDDDKQHRLQPPHQGPETHLGDADAHRQRQGKHTVTRCPFGAEQGDDIQQHQQYLCPGVQLMGRGISRKILAQGDVLQHGAPPPFRARSWRSKSSTV